ncbi:Fatty-acid amide hydrolase 1 [Elsinoe australis]|uniref:amidase n=1 Tax=Elsinoe australis TaxID=40998 RepID=A0A2P8AFI8_9PEZI|nr:Fatty-acid amide hydrolase 1 [Elsinoe australis]
MSQRPFPLLQRIPVPTGTDAFEAQRAAIVNSFISKVPEAYFVPQHFIDPPPKNVTGIPRSCGVLSPEEIEITETYDAVGLAAAIATRKYTAVAVTTAFVKRAIVCHQISCCLTQWFPDEAIARAKQLDEHLERTGKTVGPLHGVPVSIKEHIPIEGRTSSYGFVGTIMDDEHDAQMVVILRDLGAVFYVKTNQPQGIMHLESDSFFGRTLNPHNIDLSPGGSSGGESALIALRGSILGVGTDIGGSIRNPAAVCGIYGFKSTAYTLPMKRFLPSGFPAELNVLGSTGPMCHTLRDMDFFMHLILYRKPYLSDPRLIPAPWTGLKTPDLPRPLKVGIMMTDGHITPQPPVIRALEWARSRLSSSSTIDLKPYTPYKAAEALRLINIMFLPDNGLHIKEECEKTGEPLHPLTEHLFKACTDTSREMTATEITALRFERDNFRCAFADDWNEQDVDAVLCPAFVGPAAMHETARHWGYTSLWNFVDYPGVTFPTPIKAGKKGEEAYQTDEMLSEDDREVRRLWDEGDFEGAPVNLQLVTRKYHDNQLFGVLNVMKDLLELK